MQDRNRDLAQIAALVGALLLAALLTRGPSGLHLQSESPVTVAKLLGRALFIVLLGTTAYRWWEARQNRVLLGGQQPALGAQPVSRRRRAEQNASATYLSHAPAQQATLAAPAAAAITAAAPSTTPVDHNPTAVLLQPRASALLAQRKRTPSVCVGTPSAALHHVDGVSKQPTPPGPLGQSPDSALTCEPPAAVKPPAAAAAASLDVDVSRVDASVGIRQKQIAGSRAAPIGSKGGAAVPCLTAEPTEGAAASQQQGHQEPGSIAMAAPDHTEASDDGMAPKTLQEARAEMLQRQEAARARHAQQQWEQREQQRRQRLAEADARLEAWRAEQRAAEAAEEMSWSQLTAERRAVDTRRQLRQEQDDEYQQALQQDAEASEQQRRELGAQQAAADAQCLAAERAWLDCAEVAAAAAAGLSRCPEPGPTGAAAATLSLRLPVHPVQRRRFSSSATVADVYAWAQLALLQGVCPILDAQLGRLQQQASSAAAADNVKGGSGSGGGDDAAAPAGPAVDNHIHGDDSTAVPAASTALPADMDEEWVRRWAEAEAGSSGDGWVWRGGWRLVQTFPRRPLPPGDGTVESAGLMPQAALAVEQLEGHNSS